MIPEKTAFKIRLFNIQTEHCKNVPRTAVSKGLFIAGKITTASGFTRKLTGLSKQGCGIDSQSCWLSMKTLAALCC